MKQTIRCFSLGFRQHLVPTTRVAARLQWPQPRAAVGVCDAVPSVYFRSWGRISAPIGQTVSFTTTVPTATPTSSSKAAALSAVGSNPLHLFQQECRARGLCDDNGNRLDNVDWRIILASVVANTSETQTQLLRVRISPLMKSVFLRQAHVAIDFDTWRLVLALLLYAYCVGGWLSIPLLFF